MTHSSSPKSPDREETQTRMPTTFIAVQCFGCCTMQVKQQKMRSNKWNCVVCNEKQSVRKVFFHASLAKEVRGFVQNFNMARQLSDQRQFEAEEEFCNSQVSEQEETKKRNDWSEYVGDDEFELEHCGKFDKAENDTEDGRFGPLIVTEMPKAVFKKPKLKEYSSGGYGTTKLYKPQLQNRSHRERHRNNRSEEKQSAAFEEPYNVRVPNKSDYPLRAQDNPFGEELVVLNPPSRASGWNHFQHQIQDNKCKLADREKQSVYQPAEVLSLTSSHKRNVARGPVSKWSSFISLDEEDDNLETRGMMKKWDHDGEQMNSPLDLLRDDERVEDDVHPDFL